MISISVINSVAGQDITFGNQVAPIIHAKCAPCHNNTSGSAPFSLVTYEEISAKGKMIQQVIAKGIMPPWQTDASFNSFHNEIILSAKETETIKNWISRGMEPGNLKKVNYPDFKEAKGVKPDLVLHMDKRYIVKAKPTDEFTWFQIPYVFRDTTYIKSFQVTTANPQIQHHSEIFLNDFSERPIDLWPRDVTNLPLILVDSDSTETMQRSFFDQKRFLAGRFPGMGKLTYPKGITSRILPNKYFLFYAHYGPLPVNEFDSASVEIQFAQPDRTARSFEELGIHAFGDLVNVTFSNQKNPSKPIVKSNSSKKGSKLPFFIPKDSIVTFHCAKTLDTNYSAFACIPHAHHICTKMMAYAISAEGDSIPLFKINKWNFEWQFIYQFKKMTPLKKGTTVHFFGTYDNTASNPENLFSPPQDIYTSMKAEDEMMSLFIHVVPYQKGDDNKLLEYDY